MGEQYRLNDIYLSYQGKQVLAIKQQAFCQGQISALVGANGAGKSTLLKLLALLIDADEGELRFADTIVTRSNSTVLRKKIGLVPQNPYLVKGNVRHNIELGLRLQGINARERDRRVQQMLALLRLEPLANRPVIILSGGEAQKVAVGRVLVLQPDVILLDEPFTHLDHASIEEFVLLIQQLKGQQKTIILTSHDRLQARLLSDQIYNMVDGNVVQIPLYNLFHGKVRPSSNEFDTGRIRITIPAGHSGCRHLAIAPARIILSTSPLDSSMRNFFPGRVKALTGEQGRIRILIRGVEDFHVYITPETLDQMGLKIGASVFVNFKSSAVRLF